MNFIKLFLPVILSFSIMQAMEKSIVEEQVDDKSQDEPIQKPRKSSLIEKAALKASQIAARNGHNGAARFAASMGDSQSPTLAVHQATLTKNLDKKSKLKEKAALLNPGRPSKAKKLAAQEKYGVSLNTAHEYLQNIKDWTRHGNEAEKAVSISLFEDELKNLDKFYRELRRAENLVDGLPIDSAKLEDEVKINNLEVRYTCALELAAYFGNLAAQRSYVKDVTYTTHMEDYLALALTHFKEYYVLKHTDLDQSEFAKKIKAEFELVRKKAFGQEDSSEESLEKKQAEPDEESSLTSTDTEKSSSDDNSESEEKKGGEKSDSPHPLATSI